MSTALLSGEKVERRQRSEDRYHSLVDLPPSLHDPEAPHVEVAANFITHFCDDLEIVCKDERSSGISPSSWILAFRLQVLFETLRTT